MLRTTLIPRLSQPILLTSPYRLSSSSPSSSSPSSSSSHEPPPPPPSASAHLFQQALEEELNPPPPPKPFSSSRLLAHLEDQPWTGDEPLEATVLRMLIDKNKPARSGRIRSSDEKIREEVQKGALERMIQAGKGGGTKGMGGSTITREGKDPSSPILIDAPPVTRVMKDGYSRVEGFEDEKPWAGLEGDPNHQPWQSTYVSPSFATTPFIKRGQHPTSSSPAGSSVRSQYKVTNDPQARAAFRRARKLQEGAARIGRAREGALDYELGGGQFTGKGIGKTGEEDGMGGKLEVRVSAGDETLGAGWGSLVELRIEVCPFCLLCWVVAAIHVQKHWFIFFRELELKDTSKIFLAVGYRSLITLSNTTPSFLGQNSSRTLLASLFLIQTNRVEKEVAFSI